MSRVVYIAGYGRSGSTVLASMLGSHPAFASVGEFGFALEEWLDHERGCSCGRRYAECPFWGAVVASDIITRENRRLVRQVERLRAVPALWSGGLSGQTAERYRSVQDGLLGYVERQTGASVIVDSSKTAGLMAARPLALQRLGGHDVRVIHLVRDGRSVLDSLVRNGSNWSLEGKPVRRRFPAARAVVGWVLSNLDAELLRRTLGENRYFFLRFEDFLADPDRWLNRIGRFLEVDMTPAVARVDDPAGVDPGHMVGGNRVRFSGRIRLDRRASMPPRDLGPRLRGMFGLMGGWMNRRYGYGY